MPVAVERRERAEGVQLRVGKREILEREVRAEQHQVDERERACGEARRGAGNLPLALWPAVGLPYFGSRYGPPTPARPRRLPRARPTA